MKKAAITQETVVIFALAIVALLFLMSVGNSAYANASRIASNAECVTSIAVRTIGETLSPIAKSPHELNCPAKLVFIQEDNALLTSRSQLYSKQLNKFEPYPYAVGVIGTQGNDLEVGEPFTKELSEDEIHEQLTQVFAYEMGECWNLFLRGQRNLIDSADSSGLFVDSDVCVRCARIEVTRPLAARQSTLGDHLRVAPHHFSDDKGHGTYHEFLYDPGNPSSPHSCIEHDTIFDDFIVEGSRQSYDVFFLRRGNLGNSLFVRGSNWFSEEFYGDEADELESCQTVGVVRAEDLYLLCDLVVGDGSTS